MGARSALICGAAAVAALAYPSAASTAPGPSAAANMRVPADDGSQGAYTSADHLSGDSNTDTVLGPAGTTGRCRTTRPWPSTRAIAACGLRGPPITAPCPRQERPGPVSAAAATATAAAGPTGCYLSRSTDHGATSTAPLAISSGSAAIRPLDRDRASRAAPVGREFALGAGGGFLTASAPRFRFAVMSKAGGDDPAAHRSRT
jgi:hypothetical protein